MLSAQQIKAARAMLDWSQDELAQASGLSLNTVCSLENGHVSPRSSIEVRKVLESKGFDFIGTNGLSRRTDEYKAYNGTDGRDKFYDDVLATVKEKGGEVVAIFETQEHLADALGVANHANLERLERLSKFAKVRCLISDLNNSSLSIPYFQFGVIPKHPFAPFSSFTYGNKSALLARNGADYFYFVMTSVNIAQDRFNGFARDWDAAVPFVTPNTTSKSPRLK